MTAPGIVLPSVEVARHEVRRMTTRGEFPLWAYQRIFFCLQLPTGTDPLVRRMYAASAAAAMLTTASLLPDGIFRSLRAAVTSGEVAE